MAKLTEEDRLRLYGETDDPVGCPHNHVIHNGTPKRPHVTCKVCGVELMMVRGELVEKGST